MEQDARDTQIKTAITERFNLQEQLHKLNIELLEVSKKTEELRMKRQEIIEQKRMIRDNLQKLSKTLG